MAVIKNTYKRNIDIESRDVNLLIHQCEVGDVGCVVWDAGLALAKYIDSLNATCSQEHPCFLGKQVIDIGAGTGVVGLAAACVGADVLLTDLPELQSLLELNIKENQHILVGTAEAKVLKWGEHLEEYSIPDIILVGDCVYYQESIHSLVKTLSYLSGPNTEILISFEERHELDKVELQALFMELLKERFYVEDIPTCDMDPIFQSPDIHILRFRKKETELLS